MEKKVLLGAWFIGTVLAMLLVLFFRKKQMSNWGLQLTDAMHIMVGGFSALSGGFLVYKVVTEFDKLEPIVGLEGLVSMCLGSVATIWFGTTEIGGLIPSKAKKP
jgi:cadmium resistance protein CadD (predicted permease)